MRTFTRFFYRIFDSKRENLAFEESVFIFQFLNDKIHNYVKQNIIVKIAPHTTSKTSKKKELKDLKDLAAKS